MRWGLAAVALAAAAALAGCGGGDDDEGGVSPEVLRTAARVSATSRGYSVDTRSSVKTRGRATARTEATGSVSASNGRVEMFVGSPDLKKGYDFDYRLGGPVTYQRADPSYKLPRGKEWIRIDYARDARSGTVPHDLSLLPIALVSLDPRQMLAQLNATRDVEEVGTEVMGGEETTRYRATVDVHIAAELAPAARRDEARRIANAGLEAMGIPESWPVEAWVTERGHVRRIRMRYDYRPPGQPPGRFSLRADFDLYGAAPHVHLPPPRKVVDAADHPVPQRSLLGP